MLFKALVFVLFCTLIKATPEFEQNDIKEVKELEKTNIDSENQKTCSCNNDTFLIVILLVIVFSIFSIILVGIFKELYMRRIIKKTNF